jgi:hypothetical protein
MLEDQGKRIPRHRVNWRRRRRRVFSSLVKHGLLSYLIATSTSASEDKQQSLIAMQEDNRFHERKG